MGYLGVSHKHLLMLSGITGRECYELVDGMWAGTREEVRDMEKERA